MEGTTPQTPPDSGSGTAILQPPGQAPQTQPGGPTDVQPPGPGGPGGGGGGGGGGDGSGGGWDDSVPPDEGRKVGWLVAAFIALGVIVVVLVVILLVNNSDDNASSTTTTIKRPTTTTTTTTTAPPPKPTAQITASNPTVTCSPNASAVGTQISWLTTDATSVVVTGPSPYNVPQTPFHQTQATASGVGIAPSQECTAAPFTDQYTIVAENSSGQATASVSIQWLAAP